MTMQVHVGRHVRKWWRRHRQELDRQHYDANGDRRPPGQGAPVHPEPLADLWNGPTRWLRVIRPLVAEPPITPGERHLGVAEGNAERTQPLPMTPGQAQRAPQQ